VLRRQQLVVAQAVDEVVRAVLRRRQLVVAQAVDVVKVAPAVPVQFLPFPVVQLQQRPQADVALKAHLHRLS
jgi:hypothetical protein